MAKKRKGLQAARASMERRGTVGSYGHHSEKQMDKDIKKGGRIAKKAQFAKNMREMRKHKKHGRKTRRSHRGGRR